jgi:hypothetical protein
MRRRFLAAIGVLAFSVAALAQSAQREPENVTMTLARIADSQKAGTGEYVFVINGVVAFRSLDGLKKYIRELPKGSTLTWAPGCLRLGDEPLLSSRDEMERFKAYCRSCGIRFVLVPSG